MSKGDWWRRDYDRRDKKEHDDYWKEELRKAAENISKGPYKNKFSYSYTDWYQTKPALTKEEKYIKFISMTGEIIQPIQRKWFQVYTKDDNGKDWMFGFAIENDIVYHFPVHSINGQNATMARAWIRNRKEKYPVEVTTICEQLVKIIQS